MNRPLPTVSFAAALCAFVAVAVSSSSACDSGASSRWPAWMPQRTDSRYGREICAILTPSALRGRIHEEVVDDLVKLGPPAIPALFAYVSGTMEGPEPDYSESPVPEMQAGQPLPRIPRDDVIVLDALKRLPRSKVIPQVTTAVLHGSIDVKLVGVRLLGDLADPEAVEAWIDVMTAIEPVHLQRAYLQGPTETALASLLAGDDRCFTVLTARMRTTDTRLLPAIVRGIGGAGRARGVDVLLSMLGKDHELDLVVLAHAARLVEETLGTLPEEKLACMRPFLSDQDWRVRREALAALARVQDYRSFENTITALADEQRLVAQTAQWGLRRMSNQDFGSAADEWRAWYEGEIAWFEGDGARWIHVLEDDEPSRILEAARELAQHPLFKHDTAQALVPLLRHADPTVAAGIAEVLGHLGSRAALSGLVNALRSTDAGAKTAAWNALTALTGKKLPADAAAWASFARS